jgi:hypothetical protein
MTCLEPGPQWWVQWKAWESWNWQAQCNHAEILVHPDQMSCLGFTCVYQGVKAFWGREKSTVLQSHLSVFKQIVQCGQHVTFGLFQSI